MNVLKFILAVTVVLLSGYSLMTGEYGTLPYTQLLIGLLLFVMGMTEMQHERKVMAVFLMLVGGFSLFVSFILLVR